MACLHNAGVEDAHLMSGDQLYTEVINRTRAGQAVGFDGHMAQGSGDFTSILSNVLNKALVKGWEEAPTTYQMWAGRGDLKDFKTNDLVKGTSFSDILEIPEGEAPKHGSFNDTKEQTRLRTFGRAYTLTRQAMVNDDLNWFSKNPRRMTASVRRHLNRRVYSYLFDNHGAAASWVGPTMLEDNTTLFNANHGNYVAAGAGSGITQSALNTAWIAFKNQTLPSPDGGASSTIYSNIQPRYCIVGPQNAQAAFKLFGSPHYRTASDDASHGYEVVNMYGPGQPRTMSVVEEPLLDQWVTATATYPWYLAADPNLIGTITVYYLNGQDTPVTDSAPSAVGEAEGMKWTVRLDYEVACDDWRGLYLNVGR